MIEAVIFDVDGTLVDSVDLHARAWQDAFAAFGHDVPFAALRDQIGKGGDQLMPVFLSDAELASQGDDLNERRAAILAEHYLPRIQGFPAVRALFEELRRRGVTVALASSAKADELAVYKRRADIEGLVAEETSTDDAARSKPYGDIFQAALERLGGIEAARVLVVGDTPYDAEAAGKVGLRTIGVLCGGFAEERLRDAGCIAVYRDPADLLAHLDDLLDAGA